MNIPSTTGDPAKRRQILAAARHVFLDVGFERACVDVIAERAGVSKATVYNHFKEKKGLFVAAVTEESEGMRSQLAHLLTQTTGNPAVDLQHAGETLLRFLVLPNAIAFRRILISEVGRFPDLGRDYYDKSLRVHRQLLGEYLRRCHDAGQIALPDEDAERAAGHYLAMCVSEVVWPLELGIPLDTSEVFIQQTVRAAVNTFLLACRPLRSGPVASAARG